MRSPLRALLWQEWRLNGRWILLAAAADLGVCAVVFRLGPGDSFRYSALSTLLALGNFILPFFTGILLLASHTAVQGLQVSLPGHESTLPMALRKQILFRISYNLSVIALVAAVATIVQKTVNHDSLIIVQAEWSSVAYTVGMFAYVQALLWFFGGLHVGVAAVAGLGLAIPVGKFAYHATLWAPASGIAFFLLFMVLTTLVAVLGVHMDRRGVWSFALLRISRIALPVSMFGSRKMSPARAQLWFEWHRSLRMFPLMAAFITPVIFCLLFFGTKGLVPGSLAVIPGIASSALFLAACLTGILSAREDARARRSDQLSFVLAHPISDVLLARSRLQAGALSVLAVLLPLFAFAGLLASLGFHVTFSDFLWKFYDHTARDLLMFVWIAWWFLLVCWTMVWLIVPLVRLYVVSLFAWIFVISPIAVSYSYEVQDDLRYESVPGAEEFFEIWETVGFKYAMGIAFVAAVASVFYRAHRRRLVSTRGVLAAMLALVVSYVLTIYVGEAAQVFLPIDHDGMILPISAELGQQITVCAALTVALAPFAIVPLTVAGFRGR